MSTLPEQFSAAQKSQVESQLKFFQSFTSKAVESTEKVIALNMSHSRDQFEKSTAALRQLWTVKDPRDLLSLTTQSQASFDSLLAYGRGLADIAAGAAAFAAQPVAQDPAQAAPAQDPVQAAPQAYQQAGEQASEQALAHEAALAVELAAAPAVNLINDAPELILEAAEDFADEPADKQTEAFAPDLAQASPKALLAEIADGAAAPIAETSAIAKAITEVAGTADMAKPVTASFPSVAPESVNESIKIAGNEPVDATPPSAQVQFSSAKQAALDGPKGNKKR